MDASHWPGDCGDVDDALAYGSGRLAPKLRTAIASARTRRRNAAFANMLDGTYPTDPAAYTATAHGATT